MFKDIIFKGKTFRFHNPNNRGWQLLWSDGWELVDEAARVLRWYKLYLAGNWGHVRYSLPAQA